MPVSRRRSVLGLLGSWVAYWLVVGTIKLGPALLAMWRATRGPDDNRSSIGLHVSNALSLTIDDHGVRTWSGSVHLVALALWIAGVPICLWIAWLISARSSQPAPEDTRQPV